MVAPGHHELVSVVLLSYDRPDSLEKTLVSLLHQSYERLEIIVVDNPSPSSTEIAAVVAQHPTVRLIQNNRNVGYAGGMNLGLRQVTGEYVLLTEDDIVLDRNCIYHLVEYMQDCSSADLVAPIIYNKEKLTIRCAGGDFTLAGIYRKTVYGADQRDTGQFSQPFTVGYIDGATMFARWQFWQEFKGFRPEYFMYGEAVELCARLKRSGKNMAVVPSAKVYHFEPSSESSSPKIEFHKIRNFFSLYMLHGPARHFPEFLCRYVFIHAARSILGRGSNPRVFFKALLSIAGEAPSLLRERYAKTHIPRQVFSRTEPQQITASDRTEPIA